jgi:ABC-2 type transport system permease protein
MAGGICVSEGNCYIITLIILQSIKGGMNSMDLYFNIPAILAFIKTSFKKQLIYRIANWSGLCTNFFFLFIRAGVFIACYQNRDKVAGLTMIDTLTYLTLTQSFFTLMPHLGSMGLSEHIISGQIAVELSRPMNFYVMYMAKRMGIFFYYLLYRFFPVLIIGSLFGLLRLPSTFSMTPLFFLSVFLGFWISVSIMFIIEASAFWFESDRGLKVCMYGIFSFFSGLLIPLNYFPEWAMKITRLLPFSYTFNAPAQIYLGVQKYEEMVIGMIGQVTWVIVLSLMCFTVLKRGEGKVIIHGG